MPITWLLCPYISSKFTTISVTNPQKPTCHKIQLNSFAACAKCSSLKNPELLLAAGYEENFPLDLSFGAVLLVEACITFVGSVPLSPSLSKEPFTNDVNYIFVIPLNLRSVPFIGQILGNLPPSLSADADVICALPFP